MSSSPVLTVNHHFYCVFPFNLLPHICSSAITISFLSVNRGALYDLDGTGESKQYDPSSTDPRDSPPSAGPRQHPSTVTPVYVPGSSLDDEGDSLTKLCYCACVLLVVCIFLHSSLNAWLGCSWLDPVKYIPILSWYLHLFAGMSKTQHRPSAGIAVAYDHFDSFLRHTALFRSSSGVADLLCLQQPINEVRALQADDCWISIGLELS